MLESLTRNIHSLIDSESLTTESYSNLFSGIDFNDILYSILKNPLHVIQNESFMHPNGFIKLVLYHFANGSKLRLHIWPIKKAVVQNDPHNHTGNFISRILKGSIINQTFSINSDGQSYQHYKDFLKINEHRLDYKKSVHLKIDSTETFLKNESYQMNHQIIHRTVPINDNTASLVLSMEKRKEYSDVFKINSEKADLKFVGQFDLHSMQKTINNLIEIDL